MPWIPPVYFKARKLIRKNQYSAIITVSWPVSPHVVGSLLHRTIGKNIPWLVDIGDPFSFNKLTQINDFKKYGKTNYKFETKLLRDASVLSVTTQETKNDYLNLFPAAESKIIVIPPIIPTRKEVPSDLVDIGLSDKSKKNLIFTGSLRIINRRPDTLLKLFSQLLSYEDFSDVLELHFYGDIKQCIDSFRPYEELINRKIHVHGIVEKEIIDIALVKADFLVNIGNVSANQLPSKLVEYLAANHPIINIASNDSDSSWNFLSSTGIALNVLAPTLKDITPEAIKNVANFIRKPPRPLTDMELHDLTYPYWPQTISQQYLDIIKSKEK
jgi:glycosyltransferase involved in cell wall biosynthesis